MEIVDTWAARHSATSRNRGAAVVYASYCGDRIAGFYTLGTHSISRSEVCTGWFSRSAPSQVPAVLLGMLGVDEDFEGIGLGAALLRDAVLNASKVAAIAGARALAVDPVDEARRRFTAISDFVEFALRDEWRSSCSVARPDRAVKDNPR